MTDEKPKQVISIDLERILNWLVTSGVGAMALAALMGKTSAPQVAPTQAPAVVSPAPTAQPTPQVDIEALIRAIQAIEKKKSPETSQATPKARATVKVAPSILTEISSEKEFRKLF